MSTMSQAIEGAMQPSDDPLITPLSTEFAEKLSRCALYDQNDTGNAKRLREHFGEEFLHVREVGFYTFKGTHWDLTGGEEVMTRYAQRTAELIKEELDYLGYEPWEELVLEKAKAVPRLAEEAALTKEQEALLKDAEDVKKARSGRRTARKKFAVSSGNSNKIKGMIVQALPHVTYAPEEMDEDDLVFNTRTATLQLHPEPDGEGGQVMVPDSVAHDRAMRLSKCAPVNFDPKAECPQWQAFLDFFQPDVGVQRFLQVYAGYCLTGLTAEQKLLFFYGDGANGKSTFVEAICGLMGDYAGQLNPESVTGTGQRRGDQATPDLATLVGKRLVRVSELPKGEAVKEELIKALTGGEPMQVRRLHQGFFDMTPIFKAIMSGNDKPFIKGNDYGIWRRLLIVPWSVRISEEQKRPMAEVLAEFEAERSGILNWMLKGLQIYMEEGLDVPPAVEGLTQDYKTELDPIQQFVDACLEFAEPPGEDPNEPSITGRAMYDTYKKWSEISGLKPFTETALGRELPKKPGMRKVMTRIRKYANVRFNLPAEMCSETMSWEPMG
ncbi:DNA primase family protein [Pseudovibrio sp. Alg231-02]|uniref:DNA primase family protein n=1 Tax=Pseudovibrio sp. Alg231-02 TaxID=1922223 RepID=UPI000D55098D|nr:phage/plasmid primase, P4 family [Pseudovibrio sp. Alg231-02]